MLKAKILFFCALIFTVSFSGETSTRNISNWSASDEYERGDMVLFEGIRYRALEESRNLAPNPFPFYVNDDDYAWERHIDISVPIFLARGARFFPRAHRKIRNILLECHLVAGVAGIASINLHKIRGVGFSEEGGGDLHSSWTTFIGASYLSRVVDSGDTIIDTTYLRLYNNFTERRRVHNAMEKIIHNIGDAGVAFGHALGDRSGASGRFNGDKREEANERRGRQVLNNDEHYEDLKRTFFTGTIYNAIREYHIKAAEAIDWAIDPLRGNITNTPPCGPDRKNGDIRKCLEEHRDNFTHLIKGDKDKGDPIWGVTRSALAVGRFILIDFMLSGLPLRNVRILGNPFVRINEPRRISAHARDMDAVRLLHKDSLQTLSADAKLMTWWGDYQIWHDPAAHPMYYAWDIDGDGVFDERSENRALTFTVVEFLDNPNGIDPSKERFNGRARIRYGDNKEAIVNVINSSFILAARITDDEGTSATVRRQFNFNDRTPALHHLTERLDGANPFLVSVRHKNSYSDMRHAHTQENGMRDTDLQ